MEVFPVFRWVDSDKGGDIRLFAVCSSIKEAERLANALGDSYYSIEIWQLDKPEGRAE